MWMMENDGSSPVGARSKLQIRLGCATLGSMDAQALKDELSSILPGLEGVCLVYLFGSQVEGKLGPMSDYDLAVLVDRAVDGRRIQARLAYELARVLKTEQVDVVLLNRASIELAYAIIAQGTLLYEQDVATRVEYEATVLSRYGDFLPVLRTQRDDILRGDDYDRRVRRYRAALRRTERTLGQIAAAQRQGSE
jgi:predicted nucleotidyltransferase